MKVVIVHASAGAGHRRSAEALYNYFRAHCPSCDIKLLDVLDKTSPLFKKFYCWGYLFLVNHATSLWQLSFWLTSLKCLKPVNDLFNFFIGHISARKFSDFLIKEAPDFIVSTHFMPSEIAAYLKNRALIKSKLITVVTDLAVHPFWICPGTDTYVVASDFAKVQLINAGVRDEQIKEFGIPVDAKFFLKHDRSALADKFGIAKDKFTCLLVTGSFGLGPIEEIVDCFYLYKDIQLLVVCAANKNLYQRLSVKAYPGVKIFGFVDNMQELMAAADIIITKPGGLTISEVLAIGLVPIFISPIPGQEMSNAEVLARQGIGESVSCPLSLSKIVLDYKEHPDKLNRIRKNIAAFRKPHPARELCNVIC